MSNEQFPDRRKSYVPVLTEIYKISPEFRIEYLEDKYGDDPQFVKTVQDILAVNTNDIGYPLSIVATNSALNVVQTIEPESYIGGEFGGWTAKKIIKSTKKSAVLLGHPTDSSFKQNVAIKVIYPTFQMVSGDEHGAKQAHYMHKCKDKNVVEEKIAGVTDDGICFVVMEYLSGLNIVEHCISNQLPLIDRIKLFLQVCSGTSAMHIRTVVHSDLKPGNILMSHTGLDAIPKIIDMDLSLSTDIHFHDEYNYVDIKGATSLYAAPEQLDFGDTTTLSDIYSLGLILFEIIFEEHFDAFSLDTKDELRNKYGKNRRYSELLAIIGKAKHPNIAQRFKAVDILTSELEQFIAFNGVVKSYKPKATLLYRAVSFVQEHNIVVSLIFSLFLVVMLAGWGVATERNDAKEALQLWLSSYDPRALGGNREFDSKASLMLEETPSMLTDDYYDRLIAFGDGYYGNGDAKKSAVFFLKAREVNDDKYSNQRINATTKLALSYYSLAELDKAIMLLEPYYDDIFNPDQNNPYLIQMLFAAAELDSKYGDAIELFGDFDLRTALSNIKLDLFSDKKLRALTEVNIILYSSMDLYYSLPSDYSSVLSYKTDKALHGEIYPALKKIKADLEEALSILRKEELITHLEPMIYIWLSYILAELGDLEMADTYSELGIDRTILIFGLDHPRTIEAYVKRFGSFKYSKPNIALNAAKKAYSLNKASSIKGGLYFFPYQILIKAHLLNGDFPEVKRIYNEMYKEFERVKQEGRSSIDVSIMTATVIDVVVYTMTGKDNKFFREGQLMLERLFELYEPEIADVELARLSLFENNEPSLSIRRVYDYIQKYEQELPFRAEPDDVGMTMYTTLADVCGSVKGCDPSDSFTKAIKKSVWFNDIDNLTSIEKLIHQLKLAQVSCSLGEVGPAQMMLDNVYPIAMNIENKNNMYLGYWHKVKSICYKNAGNTFKSKEHAELSLPYLKYNFGQTSSIFKSMNGYKKEF